MTELETMTEAVFKAVNDYVARSIGPLMVRVAELEGAMSSVRELKDGKDGKDGVAAEVDYAKIQESIVASIKANAEMLKGPVGEQGEKGVNGKDAVIDHDFIHSEIEQMIPAPIAGEPGKPGEKGDKGADAVIDYEAIKQEIALLIPEPIAGAKGERGEKGENGINGENGVAVDGAPGRDALEIEPLSEIDFTRSYARRTYAMHRGGLWICRRSLPGPESWECVFDGIADIAFDETDNIRMLALSVETTSGRKIALEKRIPMLIFKGVWTAGEYELGDLVQRDGSMWHAKKTTTAEPGILDANREWQLLIKRGQDGKDLTQRSPANLEQKVIKIK